MCVNPHPSLLPPVGVAATMSPMSVRSDQALLRLRAEMERKRLSTRDVAGILSWSQSRVQKILAASRGLSVDDLEALCFAVGISMPESVRDHGMEWMAELTPSEFRLIELFRHLSKPKQDAWLLLIAADTGLDARPQTRRASNSPQKPIIPKGRRQG